MKNSLLQRFDKELVEEVLNANKYYRIYGKTNSPVSKKDSVDLEFCKGLYLKHNLPIYKIAMLYGVSDATMRTYLLSASIKLKGHKNGKNCDNNYFEQINTSDKAYFLGLIYADGNVMHNKRKNSKIMQIALTEEDCYILQIFNECANFKSSLVIRHKNDKKPRHSLVVSSERVYDDLVKHGVSERKSSSELSIPVMDDNFLPHFIRGFFDGDGIAKSNGYVGFCGCYTILSELKDVLARKCGLKNNTITYNKMNGIYYIQWASKKDRASFYQYLYNNKANLFLKRKHDKILNSLSGLPHSDMRSNPEYAGNPLEPLVVVDGEIPKAS